jgi:hypothetical protein
MFLDLGRLVGDHEFLHDAIELRARWRRLHERAKRDKDRRPADTCRYPISVPKLRRTTFRKVARRRPLWAADAGFVTVTGMRAVPPLTGSHARVGNSEQRPQCDAITLISSCARKRESRHGCKRLGPRLRGDERNRSRGFGAGVSPTEFEVDAAAHDVLVELSCMSQPVPWGIWT